MKNAKNRLIAYNNFVRNRRHARISLLPEGRGVQFYLLVVVASTILFSLLVFTVHVYVDPIVNAGFFEPYETLRLLMAWTTDIGKADWILIPTGLTVLFMMIYNTERWPQKIRACWHLVFLKVYYVFSAVALSGLMVLVLKNVIGRARPPYVESETLWASYPFRDIYEYASFPSGHSATVAALAVALSLLFPRLKYPALALAVWVGTSRVVLGVHYPSDVLCGLVLGGLFAWFWAYYFAKKRFLFDYDRINGLHLREMGNPFSTLLAGLLLWPPSKKVASETGRVAMHSTGKNRKS